MTNHNIDRIRATAKYLGASQYDIEQNIDGFMIDKDCDDIWDCIHESEYAGETGYEEFTYKDSIYYFKLLTNQNN